MAKHHCYRLGQMVLAMQMVAAVRFRYSAALVPWNDAELDQLHKVWLQVHRAAWRLQLGFASAPFVLPEAQAGLTVLHPRVVLIQALTTLIEQLCALPSCVSRLSTDTGGPVIVVGAIMNESSRNISWSRTRRPVVRWRGFCD